MNKRRRSHSQRGFTMLELLITLVVTIFGVMGAMALHTSLMAGNSSASQSAEASVVGSQVMESLRAKRTADLSTELTGSPTSAPPFSRTNYTSVLGRNGLTYTIDVDVAAISSSLWRMRVEVKWTDDATGGARVYPLEILRPSSEAM